MKIQEIGDKTYQLNFPLKGDFDVWKTKFGTNTYWITFEKVTGV
jgi:hypothetical protein